MNSSNTSVVDRERYQLDPAVLIYPATDHNGLREFTIDTQGQTQSLVCEDWRALWAIHSLPLSFSKEEAFQFWRSEIPELDEQLEFWNTLTESRVIIPTSADQTVVVDQPTMTESPAAAYHRYSRSYPFMNMKRVESLWDDNGLMIQYAKREKIPDIYQTFKATDTISLRKVEEFLNAEDQTPILKLTAKEKLNFLLDYAFGKRAEVPYGFNQQFHYLQFSSISKTVPSGGGKHPSEIFYISAQHSPINPGVYHYNVKNNSLDLVRHECSAGFFVDANLNTHAQSIGYLIFTAVMERAMWRYRESRSWRAVLVDTGHAVHAASSLASALQIGARSHRRFLGEHIAKLLGVPSSLQPVLAVVELFERGDEN
jgi:SagB-type dehydrogenase family enzyme